MPDVLVVCTANMCRSPLAAVLLDSYLQAHVPGRDVTVASAGVRARDGHPATSSMVAIADRWGLDLAPHRSQRVTRELLEDTALVVTMEMAHRDAVVRLLPRAASRTFALRELAALLDHVTSRPGEEAASLDDLVRAAHDARARVAVGRADVDDPIGGSPEDYEATAAELTALVERVGRPLAEVLRTG